jgi:hypothetical protein
MSEMPPEGGGGRTFLGLRPKTALIGAVVIIGGALGYFWWKGRKGSSSGAASSSASASAYSDSGQLDAIQAELDQLLQSGQGSGGGSGGGGLSTEPGPSAGAPIPAPAPKTGTTTTAPPPAAKAGAKPKPAMPSPRETKVAATSVTLGWPKVADATGYRVRVTYQGKLVGAPHLVTGTSATVGGLSPNRTYTFHVAAIGPGGTSAETNGPAVKTK